VGVGECVGSGQLVCDAYGTGTICDLVVPPAPPEPESCNGLDDDCDGATDEGLAASAPLCANQQGVCAGSRMACGGAMGWLDCDAARFLANSAAYEPSETRCTDGLDNDCDGAADGDDPTGCTP
jgi:hypothetical protein